uniref:Uncharacterized protein n=1 Tax=Anguilla anguilla TaxID=7936 RepID=A0A0E9WLM3_ANGAN
MRLQISPMRSYLLNGHNLKNSAQSRFCFRANVCVCLFMVSNSKCVSI